MRLFQVGHGRHPPLRTLDRFRHNLPIQATTLIGRSPLVTEVRTRLSDDRLVTLTGVGGVGKTRVALQVGADEVAHRADGVWLVELADLRDPDQVAAFVAAAMGAELRGVDDDPWRALAELVGDQELLLVLDNCEHLLSGVARIAAGLLAHCPRVRLLATSREPLGVPGETVMAVPSLSVDEAGTGDAERLFVERARAAAPGFAPSAETQETIAEICRRLDGIPLALELAAARVRTMAVGDIAGRLDRRFQLLTGGSRVALERHQTLRNAVDWSYSLLEPVQQTVLARLAVFVGDFDLTAAEAVVADDDVDEADVVDHVAALVDRSLVVADISSEPARYRLLETIRQYARERLVDRGETDAIADRHADVYTARYPEAGLAVAIEIGADVENLRAAFDRHVERGRDADAIRAGLALANHWLWRSIGPDRSRVDTSHREDRPPRRPRPGRPLPKSTLPPAVHGRSTGTGPTPGRRSARSRHGGPPPRPGRLLCGDDARPQRGRRRTRRRRARPWSCDRRRRRPRPSVDAGATRWLDRTGRPAGRPRGGEYVGARTHHPRSSVARSPEPRDRTRSGDHRTATRTGD